MIENTLSRLEQKIQESSSIEDDQKGDVLQLLQDLKFELLTLSKTDNDRASTITGHTDTSAQEAIKESGDLAILTNSLQELNFSIEGFEASHPKLVETINAFCTRLSTMGI